MTHNTQNKTPHNAPSKPPRKLANTAFVGSPPAVAPSPHAASPRRLARRAWLGLATLPVLSPLLVPLAPLLAPAAAQAQGFNVTGDQLLAMKLKAEGITLDFPRLADTGASVPLSANIVAPAGLKIVGIEVFLPENPNTRALKIRLTEPQAHFALTTRLRLAASQDAWVVATLSDDSKLGASAPTVITSSTCFDAS